MVTTLSSLQSQPSSARKPTPQSWLGPGNNLVASLVWFPPASINICVCLCVGGEGEVDIARTGGHPCLKLIFLNEMREVDAHCIFALLSWTLMSRVCFFIFGIFCPLPLGRWPLVGVHTFTQLLRTRVHWMCPYFWWTVNWLHQFPSFTLTAINATVLWQSSEISICEWWSQDFILKNVWHELHLIILGDCELSLKFKLWTMNTNYLILIALEKCECTQHCQRDSVSF